MWVSVPICFRHFLFLGKGWSFCSPARFSNSECVRGRLVELSEESEDADVEVEIEVRVFKDTHQMVENTVLDPWRQ